MDGVGFGRSYLCSEMEASRDAGTRIRVEPIDDATAEIRNADESNAETTDEQIQTARVSKLSSIILLR